LDLLIEYVVDNSMHLEVSIDRPVDIFNKIRFLLVTTFEHIFPIGICWEELEDFICREALGLCKLNKIIVAILANLLPMQVVLFGC